MGKERNYGIDLLRLIFMYMVCMLHVLGQGGILAASAVGTAEHKVFWLLEILAYCAVDGFAIISGYMASDKPRKYEKLADMWFQAFFYSFIVTLILTLAGVNETWEGADIIKCAMPVTFKKFWYFTAYFVLFLAIPLLNRFLFAIEEKTAKKAFIIIVLLFSVLELFGDPFVLNSGYSAIWLIILYCVGVLAKRIKLFESKRSMTLVLLWGLCIALEWWSYAFKGFNKLVYYVSPTVLLSALIMVVLFSRIRLKGTVISKLSPLAFGIYLFQLSPVIWNNVLKDAFAGVAGKPLHIGVISVFAIGFAIFASGMAVEFIRSRLANAVRIHKLSEKLVSLFDTALEKTSALLK